MQGAGTQPTVCKESTRVYLFVEFQPGGKSFVIHILEAKVPHFPQADGLHHLGGGGGAGTGRENGHETLKGHAEPAQPVCLQQLGTDTGCYPKAMDGLLLTAV